VAAHEYPFRPRSNRWLEPGQFWAVPMDGGRFACGRVMRVPADFSPRVSFDAGLMDWVGSEPPTAHDLAGRAVLLQGGAHIKAITETGGEILGLRPLELDGLEAADCRDTTWGYEYIAVMAQHLLG
jgi:hypothetical protein